MRAKPSTLSVWAAPTESRSVPISPFPFYFVLELICYGFINIYLWMINEDCEVSGVCFIWRMSGFFVAFSHVCVCVLLTEARDFQKYFILLNVIILWLSLCAHWEQRPAMSARPRVTVCIIWSPHACVLRSMKAENKVPANTVIWVHLYEHNARFTTSEETLPLQRVN